MRPSLATDQLLSWLLTYFGFVVDHRWTFRSIIDIAIDSIHIGRRNLLWITAVLGVYNPEYIGIRTHVRHGTLCPDMGFQNIKTLRSSIVFTSEDGIFCESQRCSVFTIPSTSGSTRMRETVPYVLTRDFKTSKHCGVPPKLQGRIWDCNLTNDI